MHDYICMTMHLERGVVCRDEERQGGRLARVGVRVGVGVREGEGEGEK